MVNQAKLRPLRGIIPPLATPLQSFDALDHSGLERLIEHILSGDVHGLFILGTTGEGPVLSYHLRRELIERVCSQVDGRVPVLVGITDPSYAESLKLAEQAGKSGAAAVVAAPPFYLPLTQTDLFRFIEGLARDSPLPLYLYNQPELTKTSYEPQTVARAAELPRVLGLKDSSGQISYIKQILALVAQAHPEFSVLVGPEHLLAEALLCGAHGGVPGGANIFPQLPALLYRLFREGRMEDMQQVQQQMIQIGAPIWNAGEAETGYPARLKCALSILGLCSGIPAWPYTQPSDEERMKIEAHLRQQGILSGEAVADRSA